MFGVVVISENRIVRGPIQRSPCALRMKRDGVPPVTGTLKEDPSRTALHTTCDPSGENVGAATLLRSRVRATGSPSGSVFTYRSLLFEPAIKNRSEPRTNASVVPSGDKAGE